MGRIKEDPENYDLMTMIVICLGSPESESDYALLRMLNTLFVSDIRAEDKKHILENDFNIEMTQKLSKEVFDMCNVSRGIELRALNKGIAQGRVQGVMQGIVSSLRKMVENMNLSLQETMNALDIPQNERRKYEKLITM